MYILLVFFFSNCHALGYDKFYFIPPLDDTHINDTVVQIYKLDTCFLYDENTSCKYLYYNDTHISDKKYNSQNCEENKLISIENVAIEKYLTHVQDQIDQSYMYTVSYVSTTCNEPYSYLFYTKEHCNIYGTNRYYISFEENYIFHYLYVVEEGKDLDCSFDVPVTYSFAGKVENDKCLKNGDFPWEGAKWKINPEKQEHCENATDEMGILLAFIFLMLILI